MVKEFLNDLPISEEEKLKLSNLDASTPFKLLILRKASTKAFDQHFSRERAAFIAGVLENLLTEEEKVKLKAPFSPRGKFGARLSPAPRKLQNDFSFTKKRMDK
jgi:hypothetical protein